MVLEIVREQILDDLDKLMPEQQWQAAEFVHGLVPQLSRGVAGRELLRFSGILSEEAAREISDAIDDGYERIEPYAG